MVSALRPTRPDTTASAACADAPSSSSISEAMALLGCRRMSTWRWIRAGRRSVARPGHRTSRIRREDAEQFLTECAPVTPGLRVVPDEAPGAQAPNNESAPRSNWRQMGASAHFVQFYEADPSLLDAVSEYIGAGLRAGETGIVIATEAHRADLEERLRAAGLDVDAARTNGHYVALDAAETLAQFTVDGEPEPGRFAEVVGALVARATDGRLKAACARSGRWSRY